jgi:hypothetical protein
MDALKNNPRWVVGGSLVALVLLIAVGLYVSGNSSAGPEDAPESQQGVALVSHEGTIEEDGSMRVTGVVRNTSNRTHGRVKVDVSLYDETEAKIGSTSTTTTGLGAGEEWQFGVPVPQDSVARYEIDRVTWE